MKKVSLLAIIAAFTLVFTSCSTEENFTLEDSTNNISKKYKLKRDATGAYSIDIESTENTRVDKVVDVDSNTSEFIFSASNSHTQKDLSHNLLIDNEQLKVSLIDANTNSESSITIFDDDISLQRKANDSKLASYSIKGNEDDTYTLDFEVNANVDVSFVYNEAIETYEIHLEAGTGVESSFSRTFEKEPGVALKIDFINYFSNTSSKSSVSSETFKLEATRMPRVVVSYGGD